VDTFLGSGTTLMESRRLGRNSIGIEIQENVANMARQNIERDTNLFSSDSKYEIIIGDSMSLNYEAELKRIGIDKVQLAIMHPPYWDIIKFSEKENDLSNAKNLEDFSEGFNKILKNVYKILEKGRYLVIVIGDKYSKGEWIPLGFYLMQEAVKEGFKLKSTIVKNFEETKGKMNQKELWRYRALSGDFYIFKHEYIFLLKK